MEGYGRNLGNAEQNSKNYGTTGFHTGRPTSGATTTRRIVWKISGGRIECTSNPSEKKYITRAGLLKSLGAGACRTERRSATSKLFESEAGKWRIAPELFPDSHTNLLLNLYKRRRSFSRTLFLIICGIRQYLGHLTKEHHVGFEAAAWYWHFVDVVRLFHLSLSIGGEVYEGTNQWIEE
ncbi:UNVERIFIED_CONTAM: Cytochrome c oxidase subunit [Sesamum calycinum]|uniref:Cytochrome c oxidase subunit 3 n=1 Tax=Sesamum calycinum TaxID=2727403 RepID=A0AAW2JDA2_9LAMI